MDISRITKILELAALETTPANEHLAALAWAHSVLAANGKTFADLPSFSVGETQPEWERRVQELEVELTKKTAETTRLLGVIAALRRRTDAPKPTKRRRTGTTSKPTIDPAEFEGTKEPKWTFELETQISELFYLRGMTEKQIVTEINARHAQKNFPFRVTLGMVKHARQLTRTRMAILDIYDDGVYDPENIMKTLTRQVTVNQAGVTDSYVRKVLARYRPPTPA